MEERSCDENLPNPLENVLASPVVSATDVSKKKHASEENPVITTWSGRIGAIPPVTEKRGKRCDVFDLINQLVCITNV